MCMMPSHCRIVRFEGLAFRILSSYLLPNMAVSPLVSDYLCWFGSIVKTYE